MTCAAAWQRAAIAERHARPTATGAPAPKVINVADEAWKILSVLGIGEWLQDSFKRSRAYGMQNVIVMHRLSDLSAAGAAGSREVALAEGLLHDAQTRVVYAPVRGRGPADARAARAHLGRGRDPAASSIPASRSGRSAGARSSFSTGSAPMEAELVDTDARMLDRSRVDERGERTTLRAPSSCVARGRCSAVRCSSRRPLDASSARCRGCCSETGGSPVPLADMPSVLGAAPASISAIRARLGRQRAADSLPGAGGLLRRVRARARERSALALGLTRWSHGRRSRREQAPARWAQRDDLRALRVRRRRRRTRRARPARPVAHRGRAAPVGASSSRRRRPARPPASPYRRSSNGTVRSSRLRSRPTSLRDTLSAARTLGEVQVFDPTATHRPRRERSGRRSRNAATGRPRGGPPIGSPRPRSPAALAAGRRLLGAGRRALPRAAAARRCPQRAARWPTSRAGSTPRSRRRSSTRSRRSEHEARSQRAADRLVSR